MRILAAPDKFKGTASASDVAAAVCRGASAAGATACVSIPLADGGEGTLDAMGGSNRTSTVTGPLGDPVVAAWRFDRETAVIEMAQAAGLVVAGGAETNRPLDATTYGVGELIAEAVDSGASTIIVAVGGSATTDGGLGAVEAIGSTARFRGVDLMVACDVRTRFVDAARVFGPQKGASAAEVQLLTRRLEQLVDRYRADFGVDVAELPRAGAAGGLAGGLAAIGARLVDGFEIVADRCGLDAALDDVDLVITGEGFLDAESFEGKVVGGVAGRAAAHAVPVWAVAGQVFDGVESRIRTVSLADRFGLEQALADPTGCVSVAVRELLKSGADGL